jgi:hypothetical protein
LPRLVRGIRLALLELPTRGILNGIIVTYRCGLLRLCVELPQEQPRLPLKILGRGFSGAFQEFNVNVRVPADRNPVHDFDRDRLRVVARDFEALPCVLDGLLGDDAPLAGLGGLLAAYELSNS